MTTSIVGPSRVWMSAASVTSRSVLPLLRLPLCHRHRLPVEHRMISDPADDRVFHEVLVVPLRVVVRTRVGAPALLALEARDDHARREVEQVSELERLRQVVVEDLALVLDEDLLVALAQVADDPLLLL